MSRYIDGRRVPPADWQSERDASGAYLLTRDEVIMASIADPANRARIAEWLSRRMQRDEVTGCLEWTGTIARNGYGLSYLGERGVSTHRLTWAIHHGSIPTETVDHLCGNRRCQEPSHLEDVTRGENAARPQRAKTHCPKGHEYVGDNVALQSSATANPYRRCRRCAAEKSRAAYQRSKQRAAS